MSSSRNLTLPYLFVLLAGVISVRPFTTSTVSPMRAHFDSTERSAAPNAQQLETLWGPQGCTVEGNVQELCQAGTICKDGECVCVKIPHRILTCDRYYNRNISVLVQDCFCLTSDNVTHLASVGGCIFNCRLGLRKGNLYSSFDHVNCVSRGRTGRLCGECLPDHYPLAYSFNMSCIPCPNVCWNWVRYIMAAYLPLTLFSFLILFFKIRVTHGHEIVVFFCQFFSTPLLCRFILNEDSPQNAIFQTSFSVHGIWNLDFFRPFYSDLCLGIGILPTLALDYAIAVYPLLLMIISYLLIVLYDRNNRVITIMWRPFRVLFSLFRRNWKINIKTSVIDSYATCFFLSNMKFLSVSFDLLTPTQVYSLYGDTYTLTLGLYYAGDIEYFGSEHLPYAILAIAVLCVFVILPIALLVLYPFKFFHKFLNLFPVRWYILHTFVDSFQGCYKDGMEPGTRDYRWFSAAYLFCRFLFLLAYATYLSLTAASFIAVTLMILVTAVTLLRPFKKRSHNFINVIFLQLHALMIVCTLLMKLAMVTRSPSDQTPFIVIFFVAFFSPLLYAFAIFSCWIFKKRSRLLSRICFWRRGYAELPGEDTFSDRILNPEAYPKENLASFASPDCTVGSTQQ